MPVTTTYPGVYVEEIPSGVRTITGVSTSNTAFVGHFRRGPMNKAVKLTSYADFERTFGGLYFKSEASFAIRQYYLNGGSIAYVVRVASGGSSARATLNDGGDPGTPVLKIEAVTEGEWGDQIRVAAVAMDDDRFNLVVREVTGSNGDSQTIAEEVHRDLSMKATDPRYVEDVIRESSSLIVAKKVSPAANHSIPKPIELNDDGTIPEETDDFEELADGDDGTIPDGDALKGSKSGKTGIYALDNIAPEIFNILCLPGAEGLSIDVDTDNGFTDVVGEATKYCEDKRAFFILDVPEWVNTKPDTHMRKWITDPALGGNLSHKNAAVYFPRVQVADPLKEYRMRDVGASGTMAGVFARTDTERGIWKAPAGTEAVLRGVSLATNLTDLENGGLNPLGVNVLRTFPIFGNVCWGGRTLEGADQKASDWKYIPVRRTALYIEESLYQGLKWVVFEPNDEPLWAQIRLSAGAFMHGLYRQKAFQGSSPREAYFVRCDRETTTQNDINLGVVNIVVGFAPLKPAEFVIIKLQQIANQVQT